MIHSQRSVRRVACSSSALAIVLVAAGCKKEAAPTPPVTTAAPSNSAAVTAPEKKSGPAFHVLAKSPAGISALSGADSTIVTAGAVIYELTANGLRQVPDFHQGLHPMHYWERFTLLGSYPDAAYWFGVKRPPAGAGSAEESPPEGAEPLRLYRRFKAAWGEADWLKISDSERLIGVVPWKDGRFLSVVRMVQVQDYRFALVGGKPGVALPIPTAGQKPKAQADGAREAAADAAVAEPAPEAPSDPTLSCPTILQPQAVAGNADGQLLVAGYRCTKPDELIVERYGAGKRKSTIEVLPAGGPKGSEQIDVQAPLLAAVVVNDGLAFVAGVALSYLARYDGKAWSKETLDGTVIDIGQVQGAVWMTTSAGLFLLQDGKWAKQELAADAVNVHVKKAFGLGNELYAVGTDEQQNSVLLGLRASEKPVTLPAGYAPKTFREELIVGSPVCQELFVVVKSNVKEKDNFDSMKAKLTGELVSLKLVVDNWKNGKLLGVVVKGYAQAEAVKSAFGESSPRIACRIPNVIRTVE